MSFSNAALNDAVNGVTDPVVLFGLCTGDPGTDGSNLDGGVELEEVTWLAASAGERSAQQVTFTIPPGGGERTYTHFAAFATDEEDAPVYKFGGPLAEDETFSNAGGTYNFTATVTVSES